MLIGFYIWGISWRRAYKQGAYWGILKKGLQTGGILTGFYGIGYGIEFNHFMKTFGNSKGKKTWKNPPQERDGNTGT